MAKRCNAHRNDVWLKNPGMSKQEFCASAGHRWFNTRRYREAYRQMIVVGVESTSSVLDSREYEWACDRCNTRKWGE